MVKKKGKSKRTTLKDKYKIQKRVTETQRKRSRQAKRDTANGVVRHGHKSKKDPGIPNSWPFKQDLLKSIQRTREKQQQAQEEEREKRKSELTMLREHQSQGGTARSVQELMDRASRDRADFDSKGGEAARESKEGKLKSDGSVAAGQQSRRAYLRDLKKVVDTADVLLQVLDARDPMGSRIHPAVEDAILSRVDKRMVLVLNKIDLVPKEAISGWLTTLRRSHPAIAVKAALDWQHGSGNEKSKGDTSTETSNANTAIGMDGLLQLLKNYARTDGDGRSKGAKSSKTCIVVGIIGYPNVGKSSIINALKRTRAVGVSARPGFTTSLQEVVLDRNVRLLDSPGVVFDDQSAMLGNCVDAESVSDPLPAVEALLKRCNHQSLLMTYNIPAFPPGDVMMFLAMVARAQGRVLKGGVPDKVAAARLVLKDWNNGKIPFFTPPPAPSAARSNVANDAVVVSQFGESFDLEKYDSEIMKTLKDSDEMDFVKVEEPAGASGQALGKEAQKAVDFFNRRDQDKDFSEDEMDAESEAEDYDFNKM